MAREFKFADLGEGITEGELVQWLVKAGDSVKEHDPVAEVETDKAIVEIPSPYSGKVEKLNFKEGDVVRVGNVLMTFSGEEEAGGETGAAPKEAPVKPAKKAKPEKAASAPVQDPSTLANIPALATPHTRRLAREKDIDIDLLQGTGPAGRITDADVIRASQGMRDEKAAVKHIIASSADEALTIEQFEKWGEIERKPLKGTRRTIAHHMVQAQLLTAPVTHIDEADVGELVKVREEMKEKAAAKGAKLTYLPFIIRAIQTGLRDFPALNATIIGDEIIYKKYYNIGFAVDTEEGLLVPVIKNVEDKSLLDLAAELQDLSNRARERKIDLTDLKGSSFTTTNLGSIGGRYFTPIINYPDSAILGIGQLYEKPVVRQGHIVARPVMSLNLTFDHRIADGATAARFVNHVKERIEDPQLLFMDID